MRAVSVDYMPVDCQSLTATAHAWFLFVVGYFLSSAGISDQLR